MLNGLGVRVTLYDIKKDKARDIEMKRLGGRGVPYMLIGDKKVSGYTPGAMINALNRLQEKR